MALPILVLDYTLEDNIVLQRYFEPEFTSKAGFLKPSDIKVLNAKYSIRRMAGSKRTWYGLNSVPAIIETVPLMIAPAENEQRIQRAKSVE